MTVGSVNGGLERFMARQLGNTGVVIDTALS